MAFLPATLVAPFFVLLGHWEEDATCGPSRGSPSATSGALRGCRPRSRGLFHPPPPPPRAPPDAQKAVPLRLLRAVRDADMDKHVSFIPTGVAPTPRGRRVSDSHMREGIAWGMNIEDLSPCVMEGIAPMVKRMGAIGSSCLCLVCLLSEFTPFRCTLPASARHGTQRTRSGSACRTVPS